MRLDIVHGLLGVLALDIALFGEIIPVEHDLFFLDLAQVANLIGSPDGVFQRAVQFARFKGFDEKFRNAESDGALGIVKLAVGGYHDADRVPA